jgi:transposase
MARHEITDEQFARIEHLFPGKPTDRGVTVRDNRQFINAVLWIDRVGGPWRDLPERFRNRKSVSRHFRYWVLKSVLGAHFRGVARHRLQVGHAGLDQHPCSPACRGTKKSSADAEALGRSRGGFSTKLHVAADALGNPIRFVLTPGQRSDVTQAEVLLAADRPEAVIADRGYDADWLIAHVEVLGAKVVIPPKRNRTRQRTYDRNLYADRNKVECFIGRIKHYRRVATRSEKTATNYLAMVQVAAIMTLLL